MDSPLSFPKTGSGRQVFFKELKAGAKILYLEKNRDKIQKSRGFIR